MPRSHSRPELKVQIEQPAEVPQEVPAEQEPPKVKYSQKYYTEHKESINARRRELRALKKSQKPAEKNDE